MIEEIKTAIIILILFIIIVGMATMIMTEATDTKNRRERELLYKSEMKYFKKRDSKHTYNKIPAYKRRV